VYWELSQIKNKPDNNDFEDLNLSLNVKELNYQIDRLLYTSSADTSNK